MSALTETKHDVQYWVEQSLENKQLKNINIEISCGLNGEGYMGDIIFVKVSADSNSGKKEEHHLVLKFGKKNDHLRTIVPVTEVYEQEIYMYKVVFPFYEKFWREKGFEEWDLTPKCYKTFSGYGSEVLVFDNLKHLGFKLHNRHTSMNYEHIKIVLEAYGRWHALSFALKDQKKEEYDRISLPLFDVMAEFLKNEDCIKAITSSMGRLRESLQENSEYELLRKFNKVMEAGDVQLYADIITRKPDKTVISHGDCWNNNFMFKYGSNKTYPEKVAILDWQMSFNRSPAFDVSHFLYSVASKQEFDQIDALIDIYYTSLAANIKKLGSDPDKLFTHEELMRHWREYSFFGLCVGIMVMQFALCDPEDAPSFGDLTTDENLGSIMSNVIIKNKNEYYRRVRDMVEHFTTFRNIL